MKRIFFALGLFLSVVGPASGIATEWETNPEGRVRMIVPYTVAPAEGPLYLGFHFQPNPGWMVYWKTAGEAGVPPKFDFKNSRGFEDPKVLYPRPKFFILPGEIKEYGYDHEVVYPVEAKASRNSKDLHINVQVDYLICAESCIPHRHTFSLTLPKAAIPQLDSEIDPLMQKFLSQVPPEDEDVLANLKPQRHIGGSSPLPGGETFSLGWILLLGFLGGLILNVMPCVLPVLSIKLFGLLQQAGRSRWLITQNALATAIGIESSFLALAGLAIIARNAGNAVGWGIQFQNPWFVGTLVVILILFALNLWGVFEIQMPRAFGGLASASQGEGFGSHFASGLFATVLATPCSAPFLGTAMGFALAQPPVIIVAVFLAAGTGMALPYLMLSVFPGTLRLLPRPGIWMSKVRIIMGLLLAATAVWLGWVLYQQVRPSQGVAMKTGVIDWVPFKEEEIAPLVASGKTVFVDVTADWCLTCKVNERFVLQDADVANEFKRREIVMMRADWTNQDATIGNFLKKHGRAGIPFYVLYHPNREPVLLSELLTKKQVLRELQALDATP